MRRRTMKQDPSSMYNLRGSVYETVQSCYCTINNKRIPIPIDSSTGRFEMNIDEPVESIYFSSGYGSYQNFKTIDQLPDLSNFVNMYSIFTGCTNLRSVNLKGVNATNIGYMNFMFQGCSSLTEIIGIGDLDTSKCGDFSCLFDGCNRLESLDLHNLKVDNAGNGSEGAMGAMFRDCVNLRFLDISSLDITKGSIPSMGANFYTFASMFDGCKNLRTIRCKQSFYDWCMKWKDDIMLPAAMQPGGSGVWEIVD